MTDLTGILYIVATPLAIYKILPNVSFRDFLLKLDLIAAEDTRHSGLFIDPLRH